LTFRSGRWVNGQDSEKRSFRFDGYSSLGDEVLLLVGRIEKES
jgi:hypothetical protein